MASITERAQRMEKDLRETNAKHDRSAAELQVRLGNVHSCGVRMCCARYACGGRVQGHASSVRAEKNERFNIQVRVSYEMRVCFNTFKLSLSRSMAWAE